MKDKPPANQKDSEGQEKATKTHAYVEGGIEINLGQDLKQQHKTEHDETTAHNKWQLTATFITAGLVFIYTLIALWQGCQTRKIIINTREQFEEQRRPYLWQASGEWQSPDTPLKKNVLFDRRDDGSLIVTNIFRNYGTSPAIMLRFTGDTEAGPNALNKFQARAWIKMKTVMPPGREDRISTLGIADPNIPSFEAASYVRIQYQDTGGHLFESDWCVYTADVRVQGQTSYCPPELNRNRLIDCEKEACEK